MTGRSISSKHGGVYVAPGGTAGLLRCEFPRRNFPYPERRLHFVSLLSFIRISLYVFFMVAMTSAALSCAPHFAFFCQIEGLVFRCMSQTCLHYCMCYKCWTTKKKRMLLWVFKYDFSERKSSFAAKCHANTLLIHIIWSQWYYVGWWFNCKQKLLFIYLFIIFL